MTVSKKEGDGDGAMADYDDLSDVPWYYCRGAVKSLIVEEGALPRSVIVHSLT